MTVFGLGYHPYKSYGAQYDKYSITYDNLNAEKPAELFDINKLRIKAGKYLSNNVLEIAIGTGLQSAYNQWLHVTSYTGIDESSGMLLEAATRLKTTVPSSIPFQLTQMDASSLTFPDNQFETVLDTFSICVMSHPDKTLREMKRVTSPGGRIVLIENTRSNNALIGWYQDISEPIITPLSKGCVWNTDVSELARKEGLHAVQEERGQLGTLLIGVYEKTQ
eukprot:CAMPEP_0182419818 /NCGR_PEP_ID=MMETSP1167-20130531/4179_1 /TAXON_ID=2988 /ORGANISM="Mallomonas Sp, Strain CCMP3275" /LENGTH=220 /DNA_ID=CAMNT_0024594927 /DNA_START=335 /DNA_END=997 /DNA_ORIENTATION=-